MERLTPEYFARELFANMAKSKNKLYQLLGMSAVLMLGVRCVGQKRRQINLEEDNWALKEENKSLNDRMAHIKRDLLHEASLEPTGLFSSKLRLLFAQDN